MATREQIERARERDHPTEALLSEVRAIKTAAAEVELRLLATLEAGKDGRRA